MRYSPCILATGALAVTLLASPAPAAATVTIDGRGFGHGVGMSQYGAYGFAREENRDAAFILRHYYTGTTLGTTTNRRRASLRAPVRVSGGRSVWLRGAAENGRSNGDYRGALALIRDGTRMLVVNDIHVRDYLFGVVPSEMPTSWSIEAVKAQAIAARTYTMRNRHSDRDFDLFSDVRSQAYGGLGAETARGRSAVRATDGRVILFGGQMIDALYHSTFGGRTASNDEAFGTDPVPYLRSVADPHDDISPLHTWRETLSDAVAQQRLGDLVQGTLLSLRVAQRGPSGRALQVEVRGSAGTRTVPASEIRRLLELRSTWFDFV